jgi:hypothetical protein
MNAVVQEASATVPDAFPGDAVAFLQTVYKNPTIPLRVRLDAAAKAARFERPSSPTSATNDTPATSFAWTESDDELLARLTREIEDAAKQP